MRTSYWKVDEAQFYLLNEITLARKESTSMITVHTYLNGNYHEQLLGRWSHRINAGSTGYSELWWSYHYAKQ